MKVQVSVVVLGAQNVDAQRFGSEWQPKRVYMSGFLKVGAVNVDEQKSLGGRFEIKGFPTIKIFLPGNPNPVDYNVVVPLSGHPKAAIGDRIESTETSGSGSSVVQLTDSDFDSKVLGNSKPVLVAFFAPWCGHCKRLKPIWLEAAQRLGDKVIVAELDATAHQSKASEYGVSGYPTIKFFPPMSRSSSDAMDYNQPREVDSIVQFALDRLDSMLPDPEIHQLIDQEIFTKNCKESAICVIAFLPELFDCDAKCRNDYIDLLKEEAKQFKKQEWGWFWVEARKQQPFESSLGIGGSGYPALVALHQRKMKRANLHGAFSEQGVHTFLFSLSIGSNKVPLSDFKDAVSLVSTDPWDGQDAPPLEEEEIDLSDVDIKLDL